jgi:hypothetical protein
LQATEEREQDPGFEIQCTDSKIRDPSPSQNATDPEHCFELKEDIDSANVPTFDRLIIILFMDRRHLSHFGKPKQIERLNSKRRVMKKWGKYQLRHHSGSRKH